MMRHDSPLSSVGSAYRAMRPLLLAGTAGAGAATGLALLSGHGAPWAAAGGLLATLAAGLVSFRQPRHPAPADATAGATRPAAPRSCDADEPRVARELHDSVSQTLFATNLLAATLARDGLLPDTARRQAATLERLNRAAIAEMRLLLFELRPEAIVGTPLAELLRHATTAVQARGDIELTSELAAIDPPPAQRLGVYRIAQEVLVGLARDSRTRRGRVSWHVPRAGHGRLVVAHDGPGLVGSPHALAAHELHRIRQRAAAMGGRLHIRRTADEGESVELELHWA